MKRTDLGQTINTLANIGVISGIVFLAFQVQQNSRLLSSQATLNLLQNRTAGMTSVSESPEVAAFWDRVNRKEPLTGADVLRIEAYGRKAILNWEWEYGQFQLGNLKENDLPVDIWRQAFHGDDALRKIDLYPDIWARMRSGLNPGFVALMEARVVP